MLRPALVALAFALAFASTACGGGSNDAPPPATPKPAPAADLDEGPQNHDDTGTIDVYCAPPTKVLIDGKAAGTSPIKGFKVEPGKHDVTCVDEAGPRTLTVAVGPGDGQTVTMDRVPGATLPPPDKKGKQR